MDDLVSRLIEALDERWRPVAGYETSYEVSDGGHVRSYMKGKPRLLKPYRSHTGHMYVCLFKDGKVKHAAVHTLVAESFIDSTAVTPHVRHVDGDLANNSLANLRFEDLGSEVEEWRPVVGWEGRYWVSNLGRVRGRRRQDGGLMRTRANEDGYQTVRFCKNAKHHFYRVHRLVAIAFLGAPPPGHEVRHLDGQPSNNKLSNLAWGTDSENGLDQVRHGTHPHARKTHCPRQHPYDLANTYRTKAGGRQCRACRSEASRRYLARKRAVLLVESYGLSDHQEGEE